MTMTESIPPKTPPEQHSLLTRLRLWPSVAFERLLFLLLTIVILKRSFTSGMRAFEGRVVTEKSTFTARDGKRLRVFIHRPVGTAHETLPVIFHWHGSGFVCVSSQVTSASMRLTLWEIIDCFGLDGPLCCRLAERLHCIVFECDYRKAPEHPFPVPMNDAEDVSRRFFSTGTATDTWYRRSGTFTGRRIDSTFPR